MPGKPVPALGWPGTKNSGTHQVWLPKAAQQIIAEMGNTGLVFAGPRGGAITGLAHGMQTGNAARSQKNPRLQNSEAIWT